MRAHINILDIFHKIRLLLICNVSHSDVENRGCPQPVVLCSSYKWLMFYYTFSSLFSHVLAQFPSLLLAFWICLSWLRYVFLESGLIFFSLFWDPGNFDFFFLIICISFIFPLKTTFLFSTSMCRTTILLSQFFSSSSRGWSRYRWHTDSRYIIDILKLSNFICI